MFLNPHNLKFFYINANHIILSINTYNESKQKYICSSKSDKTKISRNIVAEIKSLDPPGRFIEYDVSIAKWVEVYDKRAWEKTCQALRERKPPKSSYKRNKSKKSDGTKNASPTTSIQFETPNITTAQINSLFPPPNEQLKHPKLEMTECTYEPPAQYLTPWNNSLFQQSNEQLEDPTPEIAESKFKLPVQCLSQNDFSTNVATTNRVESNEVMKSIQPNLCNSTLTLHPFLESQTFTESEDSIFHKALRKVRRKHNTKQAAAPIEPVVNLSGALQTARDATSSIQQVFKNNPLSISNSLRPRSINMNLSTKNVNHFARRAQADVVNAEIHTHIPCIPKLDLSKLSGSNIWK